MTALLNREVPMANRTMFGKLIVGSFVVGLLASPFLVPRHRGWPHGGYESVVDHAWLETQKFANEAYPRWQRTYGDGCPHSVYELTEFLDGVKTRDPWGNRYRVLCQNGRVIVVSTGEDGLANTNDDIWSNR